MQIAFLFYDGMTALDAIGPHEILCRLPGAKVQRVARKSETVRTDSASLELAAEYSLEDVLHADVLETVNGFSFCRFFGSFEPIFNSKFGGNINFRI